jgi:hypothetical protein
VISLDFDGKRGRQKVVSYTATSRRAPDQVQKLFVRKLGVFPPQGNSIRDSFFAIQRPVGPEYPGRRYIGICPFGRRYPVAMIRSYVAHLAAAQVLFDNMTSWRIPDDIGRTSIRSANSFGRRLVEDDIRSVRMLISGLQSVGSVRLRN